MSIAVPATQRFDVAGMIAGWWREWRATRRGIAELARLGREDLARMAQDVGVERADLPVLAGRWPSSADLLSKRLQGLGLDLTEGSPGELQAARDLQRVCSLCASKRRCRGDLDEYPSGPAWRQYCPNTGTIEALVEARANRSGMKPA